MKKIFFTVVFLVLTMLIYARQVDATNTAIANASPGDYIIRPNGETVILYQGDIDYARERLGLNKPPAPKPKQNDIQIPKKPSSLGSPFLIFVLVIAGIIFFITRSKKNIIKDSFPLPYNQNTYYDDKPETNNEVFDDHKTDVRFDNKKNSPTENKKTYIDQYGYRRFTDTDKPVHRYVAEKKMGRKLLPGEVVHHMNRNKLDNRPENLQVFASQEEHDKIHKESGWYTNKKYYRKSGGFISYLLKKEIRKLFRF